MKIEALPQQVRVCLGSVNLNSAAYHQLQVGDILLLDQEADQTLPLKVGETEVFEVTLGLVNTKKAVKIEKTYERSNT